MERKELLTMTIPMGILTLTPEENQSYFQEIGKRADEFDIVLYLFSPLNIKPESSLIFGYRFDSGSLTWTKEEFSIPHYLYDRCFYGEDRESKEAKTIVSWLKARKDITFLGYGLPNKWTLYEGLKNHPLISPYLPMTKKASTAEKVINELSKYEEIILKPIDGAHGYAVYSIRYDGKTMVVKTTKKGKIVEKRFESIEQITSWLEILLIKHIFLIQPRLDNRNRNNEPFDLRVFIQKDTQGNWKEIGRGVRNGKKYGLLTNISAGASVQTYQTWLPTVPSFDHRYLSNELESLLSILPIELEKNFHPLFELGIDIIIAKDQSLWILDMNSKPGRKIISLNHPNKLESLYRAPLAYCQFLANQQPVNSEALKLN
jgi:hypothetical protein